MCLSCNLAPETKICHLQFVFWAWKGAFYWVFVHLEEKQKKYKLWDEENPNKFRIYNKLNFYHRSWHSCGLAVPPNIPSCATSDKYCMILLFLFCFFFYFWWNIPSSQLMWSAGIAKFILNTFHVFHHSALTGKYLTARITFKASINREPRWPPADAALTGRPRQVELPLSFAKESDFNLCKKLSERVDLSRESLSRVIFV